MNNKPIFIPLKSKYYYQFVSGEKQFEYRKYSGYWSEKHIYPGKDATISKGYGKAERRNATVTSFEVITGHNAPDPDAVQDVYGTLDVQLAKIGLRLN